MVSVTATVRFHEPNIEDWYATVGSRSDWFHLWSVRFLLERKKQLNIAQRWEVSLHIWIDSQGNHKSVRNCRRPQLLGWSFTCSHGGSINHFVVEMSNSWFLLVVRSQCFVFFGQSHLKSPFSFNVHPPGISVSVIPQAVAEQEGMWGPALHSLESSSMAIENEDYLSMGHFSLPCFITRGFSYMKTWQPQKIGFGWVWNTSFLLKYAFHCFSFFRLRFLCCRVCTARP